MFSVISKKLFFSDPEKHFYFFKKNKMDSYEIHVDTDIGDFVAVDSFFASIVSTVAYEREE